MNIVLDKREEILNNNNTAQEEFLINLSKFHKASDTLIIYQSLNGDLDLSMLNEYGFTNLKSIIFNKGGITSIVNVPVNIKELKIPDNLLISIKRLPQELEILDIENNYIEELDFIELFKLEKINIAHNNFTKLTNLSTTLKEIICNNNKITYINLFELNDLRELIASHNKITTIDNLPNNIINLVVNNNPNIQYTNTNVLPNVTEKNSDNNYYDSLKLYFKLKSEYEEKILKRKKKAVKKAVNKASGRRAASTIRGECIYCKRNCDTIFTTKNNHYKAICGDSSNPCELKIDIFSGEYFNILEMIDNFEDDLRDLREKIINIKLQSIFSYISNEASIELYNKVLKEYSLSSSTLEDLMADYNNLVNIETNKEKFDKLNENKLLISEKKDYIHKIITEYNENEDKNLLIDAINVHINEIIPLIKNINNLLFDKINIIQDDEDRYVLLKEYVSHSSLEQTYGENPKVISFKIKPSGETNSHHDSPDSIQSFADYLL
jgi:hypothetical protein